jgi:hypothetical protein
MQENKYLFIGEDRSELAIKMNVRWEDERLAAKQLFDALNLIGVQKDNCRFMNLFEPLRQQGILHESHSFWITAMSLNGYKPVAMGNKVSNELAKMNITHIKITHPAARGKIRLKSAYAKHLKEMLL